MKTSMEAAFAKAGRKGPQARLSDHATKAWDDALGGIKPDTHRDEAGSSAQLKELAKMALEQDQQNFQAALGIFLGSLSNDAGALTALIGGDKVRVRAGEYLHTIWLEHFGQKGVKVREHGRGLPGKKGGHHANEAQGAHAASGGGQLGSETHAFAAPAATSPSRRAAAVAAVGIFGRSIGSGTRKVGDVTRFDVLQIKRRGMIDNAIADGLLSLNWPDDQTPVSEFAAESEVEEIFYRAYRAFDQTVGQVVEYYRP